MHFKIVYSKPKSIKIWSRYGEKTVSRISLFDYFRTDVAASAGWLLPLKPRTMQPMFLRPSCCQMCMDSWSLWPVWKSSPMRLKSGIMTFNPYIFGKDIKQTNFVHVSFFELLNFCHLSLQGCHDQRPCTRAICIKGQFWGVFRPSK